MVDVEAIRGETFGLPETVPTTAEIECILQCKLGLHRSCHLRLFATESSTLKVQHRASHGTLRRFGRLEGERTYRIVAMDGSIVRSMAFVFLFSGIGLCKEQGSIAGV